MAARGADSLTSGAEFHPAKPRDEPLTTSGHKPGVKASPADNAPEFHAKTLPPGTAPPESTFTPNPQNEIPGQADNELSGRMHGKESTYTAADSLPGATSADVHTGLGHPGKGQTSTELRHDGQHTNKKQGTGLAGVGAGGLAQTVDERVDATQRGLERDEAPSGNVGPHAPTTGARGDKGALGAEERLPESAESVAAERS